MDVDVEVSFCCDFFVLFLVSGGCGIGGGFLVGGWCLPWERERKRGERDRRERKNKKLSKNNKETLFKWNGKKNRSFDIGDIIKWCVICYKIGFWDAKSILIKDAKGGIC